MLLERSVIPRYIQLCSEGHDCSSLVGDISDGRIFVDVSSWQQCAKHVAGLAPELAIRVCYLAQLLEDLGNIAGDFDSWRSITIWEYQKAISDEV